MDEQKKPEQEGAAGPGAAAAGGGKRRGNLAMAAVAIGAVLLEPELLPGIAIGLAAAMAPKMFPRAAARMRPVGQSMRKMAEEAMAKGRELGKKAKEKFAHVSERVGRDGKTQQPA